MRELVYHVATTLDGFICHKDGSIDGFPDGDHVTDYLNMLNEYDTVVMGKTTYEFGYGFGLQPGMAPYPHMQNFVFSKSIQVHSIDSKLQIIRSDAAPFISELKEKDGRPIYLCGGGAFAASLFESKLIDRLIVKLNPLLFGKGIRLFGDSDFSTGLKFVNSKNYISGVVLLTYDLLYN